MVVVHVAPSSPYNEGWGYQENLLTKYQAKLGHEVVLIISNLQNINSQNVVETNEEDYISPDGFRVIRKRLSWSNSKWLRLFSWMDVYDELLTLKPKVIFFHGLVNATIYQVARYKKQVDNDVIIVQDNHLDYNIGSVHRTDWKNGVRRFIYRCFYKMNDCYITKVYGVTPWRKEYAEKIFGVPAYKTDVLIMGGDDEKIHFGQREMTRRKLRASHGVADDEFLLISGGKIDARKKIHLLASAMDIVANKIKLLLFGDISADVHDELMPIIAKNERIIYTGWISADKVYDYFFAADLAFFPGQHSVLWEQACASKIPCVFGRWPGMEHVNNGGNSDFLDDISVTGIARKISELYFTDKYFAMKKVAESSNTDAFLYSRIAEKSLECVLK